MAFLSLAVARAAFPDLRFDAVSLGLTSLAVLPWVVHLLKEVELPGGVKVSLKEVERSAQKVRSGDYALIAPRALPPQPSFVAVGDLDPNLALTGLRIEIEKRLRALVALHDISATGSVGQLLKALRNAQILDEPIATGLSELIKAGNEAVHGAKLDPAITGWALDEGVKVIELLDAELARAEVVGGDLDRWLEEAEIILAFEGKRLVDLITQLLAEASADGSLMLGVAPAGDRERARIVLERLGAIDRSADTGKGRMIRYTITNRGTSLLKRLQSR